MELIRACQFLPFLSVHLFRGFGLNKEESVEEKEDLEYHGPHSGPDISGLISVITSLPIYVWARLSGGPAHTALILIIHRFVILPLEKV